jgi:hypothetical protein
MVIISEIHDRAFFPKPAFCLHLIPKTPRKRKSPLSVVCAFVFHFLNPVKKRDILLPMSSKLVIDTSFFPKNYEPQRPREHRGKKRERNASKKARSPSAQAQRSRFS